LEVVVPEANNSKLQARGQRLRDIPTDGVAAEVQILKSYKVSKL
jgi:hypothetical protein